MLFANTPRFIIECQRRFADKARYVVVDTTKTTVITTSSDLFAMQEECKRLNSLPSADADKFSKN